MKNLLFIFIALISPIYVCSQNMEVQGAIKIVDGTQGINKVLTSNADGLASWQAASPSSATPTYYQSVNICCNSWMTKNLDVDKYRNGDPIAHVTDSAEWAALTTGAYCYYLNDSTTYAAIYGKLYNWYAVNDSRGLAPEGWHVPTDFEWTTTIDCLGGSAVAGGPMKEMGTAHWMSPNTGATNLSGFAGVPGGVRKGTFFDNGSFGLWWSSSEFNNTSAWLRILFYDNDNADVDAGNKGTGFSVRCVRD